MRDWLKADGERRHPGSADRAGYSRRMRDAHAESRSRKRDAVVLMAFADARTPLFGSRSHHCARMTVPAKATGGVFPRSAKLEHDIPQTMKVGWGARPSAERRRLSLPR